MTPPDKQNVKAVILVMGDESLVTTDRLICAAVPACFSLANKCWKILSGTRPWKAIDKVLDGK